MAQIEIRRRSDRRQRGSGEHSKALNVLMREFALRPVGVWGRASGGKTRKIKQNAAEKPRGSRARHIHSLLSSGRARFIFIFLLHPPFTALHFSHAYFQILYNMLTKKSRETKNRVNKILRFILFCLDTGLRLK